MVKAYFGLMGSGKTLSMVKDIKRAYKKGKGRVRIITNTPFAFCEESDQYIWTELEELKVMFQTIRYWQDSYLKYQTILVIDESGGVFQSRNWKAMPHWFVLFMSQVRKANVDVYITAQAPFMVDKQIRTKVDLWLQSEEGFFNLFIKQTIHSWGSLLQETLEPVAVKYLFLPKRFYKYYWHKYFVNAPVPESINKRSPMYDFFCRNYT